MDMLVLCRCGHPTSLHGERGCNAGRYRPCECLLNAHAAVEAAVAAVRAKPWRGEPDDPKLTAHK
jgi:hypothetical protein